MLQHVRTRALALTGIAFLTTTALAMSPATGVAASAPDRVGDAPAKVLGVGAPNTIKDRYVVVFKKHASHNDVHVAKNEIGRDGARVHFEYRSAIKGFAATMSQRAVDALRRNAKVEFIEADQAVSASTTQSPVTWGLDRVDQRTLPLSNAYTYTPTGAGVTAYVVDTGIRRTHSEFGGRAVHGYSAINDDRGSDDCNGHGTHVAGTTGGTAYGVAKAVHLVAVRVLGCDGSGTTAGVIAGVDWVTGDHSAGSPAVANMSLGGGVSSALDSAVTNSINDGVTYAVAAGNESTDACNGSPSRVGPALTVGSTTRSDARSSFSNFGSCLDLFAPGSSITSAWHTSDVATNTISGTSMATPHVAGVAALYLQDNASASPAQVGNAILSSATTGVVTNPGSGSPNRLLYSHLTGGGQPPPLPDCSALPELYAGSLSGTGAIDYQPEGAYFYTGNSGMHRGCLAGPSGPDFDLYLQKWNGWSWVDVASGTSPSSLEDVTYNGTAGYYRWEIYSYSGSGAYTLRVQRP